jgi:hypothetical protein
MPILPMDKFLLIQNQKVVRSKTIPANGYECEMKRRFILTDKNMSIMWKKVEGVPCSQCEGI